jgi:ligand-binding sensor domain-containing protein/serine phosphatase RsbU (regulator of sigma subunit)
VFLYKIVLNLTNLKVIQQTSYPRVYLSFGITCLIKSCQFILLIIYYCLLSQNTKAQTYNFTNHTVETGLRQGQILAVYQDKQGVMWFGTNGDGITKYDGISYEYITDKGGLPDNTIYCITEDEIGNVLIGTNNGLSVYKDGKFKNYTTANGLTHNRIFSIFIDSKHSTLLGTALGLCTYANGSCKAYKLGSKIDNANIFSIYEDSHKALWLSTLGSGLFKCFKNKVKNYTTVDGLRSDDVFSFVEFEKKHLVFTISGMYELKNDIPVIIKPTGYLADDTYNCVRINKNNILWIGTNKGILKYSKNEFKHYSIKNGLVDNSIWKIFEDREHNLWFASNNTGVSKYTNDAQKTIKKSEGIIENEVTSLYQSENNQLYIGTKNGLSIKSENTFENISINDNNADIYSIVKEELNSYLLATSNGVIIKNNSDLKHVYYKDKTSSLNVVYKILINNKKEILLGTEGGIGILKNNEIQKHTGIDDKVKFVQSIYEDKYNNLWIGTDDGLYKYDGKKTYHFSAKDGCTEKPVQQLIGDKQGNIWIATAAGIHCYNGKKFSAITEKDGITSNDVYSIVFDKYGALWAGFEKGLDKIELNKNELIKIKHFNVNECSTKALLFDDNGHLLIGTKNGLVTYQPEYDRANTLAPLTRIKNIELFNRTVDWKTIPEADSVSNEGIPVHLTLPYNKNYLTFNYVGVSHTTPQKVRYQYMLKGLDKDWMPITQKTQVEYANLPFGKYEFLLKAENGEGVWNATPLSYKFEIRPPFWRTWWMYSILAAIVFSGIYSYFKIRNANKKISEQNILIEEKNNNITDSINYAKRIQQAFLASNDLLKEVLPNHFIYYKPKDIVSGDFYWCQHTQDKVLITCADSTGHGIPGAFMSLIGINILNECFHSKNMSDPAAMLNELRRVIILALNPHGNEDGGKDGMDMTLLSIAKTPNGNGKYIINYAGANNPLYVINGATQELTEYKVDKQPVAYYHHMKPFTALQIEVNKGDTLYMTTDGYPDQFGGEKEKKFMTRNFKQLLVQNCKLPMPEQLSLLQTVFNNWKGKLDQIDDVTVIGIKI